MEKAIREICAADGGGGKEGGRTDGGGGADGGRTWCYLSGPNAFIEGGERACRRVGVEYYGARWS